MGIIKIGSFVKLNILYLFLLFTFFEIVIRVCYMKIESKDAQIPRATRP